MRILLLIFFISINVFASVTVHSVTTQYNGADYTGLQPDGFCSNTSNNSYNESLFGPSNQMFVTGRYTGKWVGFSNFVVTKYVSQTIHTHEDCYSSPYNDVEGVSYFTITGNKTEYINSFYVECRQNYFEDQICSVGTELNEDTCICEEIPECESSPPPAKDSLLHFSSAETGYADCVALENLGTYTKDGINYTQLECWSDICQFPQYYDLYGTEVSSQCPAIPNGKLTVDVTQDKCNDEFFQSQQPVTGLEGNDYSPWYYSNFEYDTCRNTCTYEKVYCPENQGYGWNENSCVVPPVRGEEECSGDFYCINTEIASPYGSACGKKCYCDNVLLSETPISCSDTHDNNSTTHNDDNNSTNTDTPKELEKEPEQDPCTDAFDAYKKTCEAPKIANRVSCKHNGLQVINYDFECIEDAPTEETPTPESCRLAHNETFDYNTQSCKCLDGYSRNTFGTCWKNLDTNATAEQILDDQKKQDEAHQNDLKEQQSKEQTQENLDLTSKSTESLQNLENISTGIRKDLNTTNDLLKQLNDNLSTESEDEESEDELPNYDNSIEEMKLFTSNLENDYQSLMNTFLSVKNLIDSGFDVEISTTACAPITFTLFGKTISIDIFSHLSILRPLVTFLLTSYFLYLAIKIYIKGLGFKNA